MAHSIEGTPPALSDEHARRLLEAPREDTLKGLRDRAILATLLYHGMRREELCSLKVKDLQSRQGVIHFKVKGKRGKIRFVPAHAQAQRLIESYLLMAGHGDDHDGPLFRPVRNNRTGELERPLNANSIYPNVVRKYGQATGCNIEVNGLCVHSMRATAATNALSHESDIAKVQEWLGHACTIDGKLGRRTRLSFGCGTRSAKANGRPPATNTKKESSAFFKDGAYEQRNFYILFLRNVFATRSKCFHCPVRFSCYRITVLAGTRKNEEARRWMLPRRASYICTPDDDF